MDVVVMRFGKKKNSLLAPAPTAPNQASYDCVLKQPVDILAPVLEIEVESVGVFLSFNYNYARITQWGRYYYITNTTVMNSTGERGIVKLQLAVDALASNSSAIRAATGFVVRSESNPNPDIIDKTYPAMAGNVMTGNALSGTTLGFTYDMGTWAMGIVGNNGATKTLITTRQGIDNIFNALYGEVSYADIDPEVLTSGVTRLLLNPGQYVTNLRWYPIFPGAALMGNLPEFFIGWWDTGWRDLHIARTDMTYNFQYTAAIPKHPQSNTSNRYYLNTEPFSKYYLYFPPFGAIPIDSMYLYNKTGISCELTIDYISGLGTLAINGIPQVYTADIGVNHAIQMSMGDKSGMTSIAALAGGIIPPIVEGASAAAEFIASIPRDAFSGFLEFADQLTGYRLLGGNDADAITGATVNPSAANSTPVETKEYGSSLKNTLSSAAAAYQSNVFVGTATKSPAVYQYAPTLYGVFTHVTTPAPSLYGYPCNQQMPLAQLSGFASIDKPQITQALTMRERTQIERALAEGVYFE